MGSFKIIYVHDIFSFSFSYPTKYIYRRFMKFFEKYPITSTSIIPMILDENEFLLIRHQLIDQTSIPEHQRAARLVQMFDYNKIPMNIDPLVEEKLLQRKEKGNAMILHYTFEKRYSHIGRSIHQIWDDTLQNTSFDQMKLISGTRNHPNLSKELIRRNPFNVKKSKNDQ